MFIASLSPGFAQSAGCDDVKPLLEKRQKLIAEIQSWSAKKNAKVDPRKACSVGKQLVSNGTTLLKWLNENKDWCGVPDSFVTNIENDHKQSQGFQGGACKAAAQAAKMEKMQREGGGIERNPLGGGGLSGQWKIPQGAL